MNRYIIACVMMLFISIVACNRSTQTNIPQGKWTIKTISIDSSTGNLDTLSLTSLAGLSLAGEEMKPTAITITSQQLVLKTTNGDSVVLNYKQKTAKKGVYTLETDKGQCVVTTQPNEEMTLSFAGITYYLKH